jgi:hypothetical protein
VRLKVALMMESRLGACARNFLNLGRRRVNLQRGIYDDLFINFKIYLNLSEVFMRTVCL